MIMKLNDNLPIFLILALQHQTACNHGHFAGHENNNIFGGSGRVLRHTPIRGRQHSCICPRQNKYKCGQIMQVPCKRGVH